MSYRLLTVPDQKEGLSVVYVRAVATRAGFLTSVPEPDRDSVDLRIQAGGVFRPALDLQIKATAVVGESSDQTLPFRLSEKNYRDLRIPTQTPRLLVVLELPREENDWLTLTREKLILRRCAYWLSLQRNHEPLTGQKTVTVRVSKQNVLDVDSLRDLMEKSRRREL